MDPEGSIATALRRCLNSRLAFIEDEPGASGLGLPDLGKVLWVGGLATEYLVSSET